MSKENTPPGQSTFKSRKRDKPVSVTGSPPSCPICSFSFSKTTTVNAYTKHVLSHSVESDVENKCEECERVYVNRCHLLQHMRTHHSPTTSQAYSCSHCSLAFHRKDTLVRHISRCHTTEYRYSCDKCDKKFLESYDLKRHESVHSGQKFFCDVCSKAYSEKSSLAVHRRQHEVNSARDVVTTNNRNGSFPCPDCGKVYTRYYSMLRHCKRHSDRPDIVQPFGCELCGKRFTRLYTLTLHKKQYCRRQRRMSDSLEGSLDASVSSESEQDILEDNKSISDTEYNTAAISDATQNSVAVPETHENTATICDASQGSATVSETAQNTTAISDAVKENAVYAAFEKVERTINIDPIPSTAQNIARMPDDSQSATTASAVNVAIHQDGQFNGNQCNETNLFSSDQNAMVKCEASQIISANSLKHASSIKPENIQSQDSDLTSDDTSGTAVSATADFNSIQDAAFELKANQGNSAPSSENALNCTETFESGEAVKWEVTMDAAAISESAAKLTAILKNITNTTEY